MAMRPMGPRRHWVILGSFIPRPILWDSDISSIRVKWILLNLTLGSRYHFHPESPLLLMIVCCTRRPWRYSPLLTRELVFIAFAIPLPPQTLMDNYLHLPFIRSSPIDLVIRRYPEVFSIVPRILRAYCLAVLCHMNTPSNKSPHLSSIRSSPVVHEFHKSLQNTIRSSENPLEPLALEILACLHYG